MWPQFSLEWSMLCSSWSSVPKANSFEFVITLVRATEKLQCHGHGQQKRDKTPWTCGVGSLGTPASPHSSNLRPCQPGASTGGPAPVLVTPGLLPGASVNRRPNKPCYSGSMPISIVLFPPRRGPMTLFASYLHIYSKSLGPRPDVTHH